MVRAFTHGAMGCQIDPSWGGPNELFLVEMCPHDSVLVWMEMFYLMTQSTHYIYGYMASDIWLKTIQIAREETCCLHMGYSFRLAARVLLYASSHRQDNTYHNLCYTSCGALAGCKNTK